eukprot:SAG11_NODE_253_length_11591_cov_15.933693_3_plen_96_part_00
MADKRFGECGACSDSGVPSTARCRCTRYVEVASSTAAYRVSLLRTDEHAEEEAAEGLCNDGKHHLCLRARCDVAVADRRERCHCPVIARQVRIGE